MPKSQKVLEAERQTRDKWQSIVHEWRNSNLAASAYCREQQLNIHKFKYWQYQFAPETKKSHQLKRPLFSQVQIAKTNPVRLKQDSSVSVFELIIREQIKLQIPSQFDAVALKRLLDCLGAN